MKEDKKQKKYPQTQHTETRGRSCGARVGRVRRLVLTGWGTVAPMRRAAQIGQQKEIEGRRAPRRGSNYLDRAAQASALSGPCHMCAARNNDGKLAP